MGQDDTCQHIWASPGAIHAPTEGGLIILVPLYCTRCAAVQTKISPPPEQPPAAKIARAQLVPTGPLNPLQRR